MSREEFAAGLNDHRQLRLPHGVRPLRANAELLKKLGSRDTNPHEDFDPGDLCHCDKIRCQGEPFQEQWAIEAANTIEMRRPLGQCICSL